MKRFLLVLLLALAFSFYGQEKGYLEFSGRCVKDNQPLKGANVSIFKGPQKVTEVTTGKNGKFEFFLDFTGVDYKIVFQHPGCPDMYLVIYAGKVELDKEIFPIYDIDVNFFEYGKPTINYANFKNPFTKVVFDGKKGFRDDESYAADFLANLYIDPEEIRKRDEQMALEKQKKELEAKMKLEAEEKLKHQLAEAQKRSQEEADLLRRQLEEKARQEKLNEARNAVTDKESDSKESMVSEEVQLTIEKEKRNIKEKQNKAVKAAYENDLLKIVATNERKTREAEYVKRKDIAASNEIIETLKKEAETKAMSEQVVFDAKMRNKRAVFNRGIKNQEMLVLIKQAAFNARDSRAGKVKVYPEVKSYRPPGLTAITTDVERSTFKTVYTVTLASGRTKNIYRKEKFNWGVTYYYKNDKEISEHEYLKEVSPYNIPL